MMKYPIYVTLDTNFFDAAQYDFGENSTLQMLVSYVKKGKVKIVLSNIVVKEAEKHIAARGEQLCSLKRRLRKEALKVTSEYQIEQLGLEEILDRSIDKTQIRDKSIKLLHQYIKDLGAEILDMSTINLDEIIDDYFEIKAPFQEGEKKRKEFPDAFIANQIRERFGKDKEVAIISKDKGFKEACQSWKNHLFYDTLGKFYDDLSKNDAFYYQETIDFIKTEKTQIEGSLSQYIESNDPIEVIGMSYDRKGVSEGYDYIDTYLREVSNVSIGVHSVDEIEGEKSIVTLGCKAEFVMDCYYEDYDDAIWDSEEKQYAHVETSGVREEHNANFGCRIEINREEKSFEILPFLVRLGEDSRKDRYEIEADIEDDYEKEIEDMEREAVGMKPLGCYAQDLEEDIINSKMKEEFVERFSCINDLYREYEDLLSVYDALLELLSDKQEAKKIVHKIFSALENVFDFSEVVEEDDTTEQEISTIEEWAALKYEEISRKVGVKGLPDYIGYGDDIKIVGLDDTVLNLTIDEINIHPSEGEKERIDIALSDQSGIIADGFVELTVGYIEINEDGGIGDGLEDDITYNYGEIMAELDEFILEQKKYLKAEERIVELLKKELDW